MISSLIIIFPTFIITLIFIFFTVAIQTVNGTSNTTMGIPIPNATLPGVDNSQENDPEDRNTHTQNCQVPPCLPGQMCIQVCPESVPK